MIEYVEAPAGAYQPGVCNIGPAEVRRRRQIGYLGIAGAIGLGAMLLAADAPAALRLAVAAPATIGLSGLAQAHLRFCAGYGMAGLRNLGQLGQQEAVDDTTARAADRRRAVRVHAATLVGGLLIGITFAALPI
jgi:hypothetical protein